MKKDIIVCAYNCGGPMNCEKEAAKFAEPPFVLWVPGNSSSQFQAEARKYRSAGSMLAPYLAKKLPAGVEPRRVCLASFSAGWRFSTEIMSLTQDREAVDCAMVMDGIHTEALDGWKEFAEIAGYGGSKAPKCWLVHTQIKPPYVSTKTTNTKIIDHARAVCGEDVDKILPVPDYIFDPEITEPVKIYSSIVKPQWKTYNKDPLYTFESVGNVSRFEYKGEYPQDHIYNAHYAQPRFWHWLRKLWADTDHGVKFKEEV